MFGHSVFMILTRIGNFMFVCFTDNPMVGLLYFNACFVVFLVLFGKEKQQ